MNESRKQMNEALKATVIPHLRDVGFKGSFPHFRRLNNKRTELLTFQFSRYGGQFVVEIAVGPTVPFEDYTGKKIEPKKMTAHDLSIRKRIGPKKAGYTDFWFIFEGKGAKPMNEICDLLIKHIDTEAETYWTTQPTKHNKSG
ncbi:MAG: DUF4304 domain-containing protein [Opitutaceae bacterium]